VDTAHVVEGTFYREILSNGKLEALRRAELRFRQGGEVQAVFVKNGEWVQKGQLLARLDTFPAWLAWQQAKEAQAKAQMEFGIWRIEMSLDETDSAHAPPTQWATGLTKSGLAQARLATLRAARSLEECSLRAPFAGRVANLETQAYQLVTGADPFCALLQDNQLQVSFPILESERQYLNTGQPVSLSIMAISEEEATASITEINPVVNEQGLIQVRATLSNPGKKWISGMNVKVSAKEARPGQMIVPKSANIRRQERDVIFTWSNDTVYWNYVQISGENQTQLTIEEGLRPGQIVVTDGQLNLSHQALVKIRPGK
ncbi:MAG: efflux RND transporter periplasmic adaptor subunit, partial [Bacteroidia bacterium]|nr:efflux RND transporter periplasmic adaptor subunit [Bacteroidia bacterium]